MNSFKKVVASLIILCFLTVFTAGCGNNRDVCYKGESGKQECYEFDQFGLFNGNNMKNPNVKYKLIIGNVIWSIILIETIIVPIILVGWFMFEPVGPAVKVDGNVIKGASNG